MIAEALQGGIDLILTKEVCRFARNTVDTLSYTRRLKDRGVGVIFTIDNIDTRDSDGELRLTIMASIAQEESRKTSERVKWGQKRRMEQGVVFGRDLIGYTVRNGVLSVNEEEVPIVRAIFHKYTNEGKGTHIIARELAEEGLRPKRVRLWSGTVILRVLRNEKYVGDLCQKKTFTPNYLTHAKKINRGIEETVYIKDHHQPIIDRNLWNRTQEELRRRAPSEEVKSKYSNRYWCSGKLYCGLCGQRYVSRTKNLKNGTVYKAWRCYAAVNHGAGRGSDIGENIGCDNGSVNEKALLACVRYCVCRLLTDPEGLKKEAMREIQAIERMTGSKQTVGDIREKRERLYAKRRKTIDLMLEGLISEAEFREQTRWYEEQIADLSEKMLHYDNQENTKSRQVDRAEEYFATIDKIMDFDEVNESLYREVVDKIIIYRNNIVCVWLKAVPFGMRLTFCSHGRNENYSTDILAVEVIECRRLN